MTKNGDDPEYVAVIGDIRGSRQLDDRRDAQTEFEQLVADLNDRLPNDSVASPVTVTTGDEFQVLLRDATAAVDAAVWTTDHFHPARLRFGIGRGTLTTEVNRDQAIGMDGPCFHQARAAIEAGRSDGAWVRVGGWSDAIDSHVNVMFDLVQCVREDWTDRQAEFAVALAEEGLQKHVAERYDVSKSTVSESLSAGHVGAVRRSETALAELLQETFAGP